MSLGLIINTPGQVTCWQQRADPEVEANVNKRRKQRPVSIAGDSVDNMTAGGMRQIKRTPSMGSLVIPEDGVMCASSPPASPVYRVIVALCAFVLTYLVGYHGPMCNSFIRLSGSLWPYVQC